jgi:alkanesulfonate monooxygenase SsuD/methylene tetrahydromethanopterin reductase-like flavin-dependent oxidoreductase (luciferase family)
MKVGLAVKGRANPNLVEKLAVKAEDQGYDYFLVTDHYMQPNWNDHPDVWTLLAYLAAKTSRIKLGTCVTPLPLRPPAIFAKTVATLDNLSDGRVIVGAGYGWYRPEFEAFSTWFEPPERIAYSREALRLILELWNDKEPRDSTGRIKAKGVVVEPKPIQRPHPPIWWGGHLSQSLRTAGTYADGWMPIGPRWFDESYPKPDAYAKMHDVIAGLLKKRKYPVDDFAFTILISIADIDTLRKDVERYADSGMNQFTLGHNATNDSAIKDVETVMREIGGSIR